MGEQDRQDKQDKTSRDQRLRAALRENLKRRKAQARGRKTGEGTKDDGGVPPPGPEDRHGN